MIKVETAKATKLQLDWGVAVATDAAPRMIDGQVFVLFARVKRVGVFKRDTTPRDAVQWYKHDHPVVWGGLIKEHKINIDQREFAPEVWAAISFTGQYSDGKTYDDFVCCIADTIEKAVARCVILKVLGEYFECPDELVRGDQS